MWTLVKSQIIRRYGRTVALLAGIAIAVSSFTVLTATTETSRLTVVGVVRETFRSTYDVLVRPSRSRLPEEVTSGLVRPNFLSDHFGGITLQQVDAIRQIPGVEVAAPIAMVGFSVVDNFALVDVHDSVPTDRSSVFRLRATRVVDAGLTRIPLTDSYAYFTPNRTVFEHRPGGPFWEVVGDELVPLCNGSPPQPATPYIAPPTINCLSLTSQHGQAVDRPGSLLLRWPTPFLVAAVDPAAEAALVGLDRAVTGDYLPQTWADAPTDTTITEASVPVLYSSRPTSDTVVEAVVEALPEPVARAVPGQSLPSLVREALPAAPGRVVWSGTLTSNDAHRGLVAALRGQEGIAPLFSYWTPGPVEVRADADGALTPTPVPVPDAVWSARYLTGGIIPVPPEAGDVQFRQLTQHGGLVEFHPGEYQVRLRAVGTFDPAKVAGVSELTRVPLTTYLPPRLTCADEPSCRVLGGRDLLPNGSPGGYLQQPPLMLTTMDALPAFYNTYYRKDDVGTAPVSAVRVRVAGVSGIDEVSRERVRLVAEQIATSTGLDVDVTIGSSPESRVVHLPAGQMGRPALTLHELWTRKGVAAVTAAAVDRKSLMLFFLVLVVCALFVGNAAASSVRSRRAELGLLSAVGWTRRGLFAVVLVELLMVGLVAGVLGAAAAYFVASWLEVDVSWLRALLAIPAALALTLAAGTLPAWWASRASPMQALRPAVSAGRRTRLRLGVLGFAVANLRRRPGRALLGGGALALGTAAFTLLLAVTTLFQGSLVGTLLGEAIAVRIRGVDYAAVVAMLILAMVAVADVLYLNVRDRASEFATLRATGWTESGLATLIGLEGLVLGIAGAAAGAATGALAAAWFAGTTAVLVPMVPAAATTAAVAAALAAMALIAPIAALRRQSTVRLLAEE